MKVALRAYETGVGILGSRTTQGDPLSALYSPLLFRNTKINRIHYY
jgi:hypothetical protein